MGRYDHNTRLKKRVWLHAAAIYLPTFTMNDDMGNFQAAEELLDPCNIGLRVWPLGGSKESRNSLPLIRYAQPIGNTASAYRQLRQDVDQLLRKNGDSGYPFVIPIVFCRFEAGGLAITPHSTKIGCGAPACLIATSGLALADKMTILHEMGHSALYPNRDHDSTERGNLMHEAEPRTFLFEYQIDAFAKAFFTHAA